MKKMMSVCMALVLVLAACCAAAEAGEQDARMYYTDESGISFPYMDGWEPIGWTEGESFAIISFLKQGDAYGLVLYLQMDWWEKSQEAFGKTDLLREQMNGDYFTEDFVTLIMGISSGQNIRTETYGETAWRVFDGEGHTDDDRAEYNTTATTMDHGYIHNFRFSAATEAGLEALRPEFEALLAAVRFTAPEEVAPVAGSQLDCIGILTEGRMFPVPGEEIAAKILVRNIGDEDFPGPAELYDPDLNRVEEFGSPVLKAGESLTWEGRRTLTQEQLEEGMITFHVRYEAKDEATGEQTTREKEVILKFTYSR